MHKSHLILAAGLFVAAGVSVVTNTAVAGGHHKTAKKKAAEPRAVQRVRAEVVKPMNAQFEARFMFSRARVMPPKRTVQTLAAQRDAKGREFVPFTVASTTTEMRPMKLIRRKAPRQAETVRGCYYPADDAVYLAHESGALPAKKHPRFNEEWKPAKDTTRCLSAGRALSLL